MAGDALQRFSDFVLATRPKLLSSVNELESQATKYRTHLFPVMLRGLSNEVVIQSGSKIVDQIQLSYTSSFRHFNSTDTFSYTGTNSLTQIEVPWRFSMVDSVIHEHELLFNQSGDERTVYKKVKRAKQAEMELSFWEGMEDALWATPDNATMEASTLTGTGAPLSLQCFITTDGLAPPGFTTVMGVNPTTNKNWRNQVATYDNTSQTTRENTFIEGMDELWLVCQFRSPSNSEEFVKNTKMNKYRILLNRATFKMLVKLATSKNNILTPRNDIGYQMNQVVYHGIPTDYIAKLDFIDNSGTNTDALATQLFRARFVNFNHIRPVFHSKVYRRLRTLDGGASNPNAMVMIEDTAHNLWCSNRREQGILVAA